MTDLKLCTFEAEGRTRVGAVIGDQVHDANRVVATYLAESQAIDRAYETANRLVPPSMRAFIRGGERALETLREAMEYLRAANTSQGFGGERLVWPLSEVRLFTPTTRPGKIICMALMFMGHIESVGEEVPSEPHFFLKPRTSLLDPDDYALLPKFWPDRVTFGTELTIVIGRGGLHISKEDVWDHIYGYTILNDLTLRGKPGISRKTFMTSAPLGPWIVPQDLVPAPQDLRLLFRLNGKVLQDGNMRDALFDIPTIVSVISDYLELEPGDVIALGDLGSTEVLKSGDVMECEVEGIGVLRNPVKAEE